MIKGEKIGLTSIEKQDLEQLQIWRNVEEFRKNFREYREINSEMQIQWYEQKVCKDSNTIMFSIRDISNNELVGCCGFVYINWIHRYADLSFYIGKNLAYVDNEGFADESVELLLKYGFGELGLNKIWTEIFEFDTQKISFLERKGFIRDGILRQNYFYNGTWWNSIIFSKLCSEHKLK